MNAVAERSVDQLPLAPAPSESAAILSVIERMALNPEIDPDRIERFIALKERMEANAARKAYAAALSELQAELPVVEERGRIEVRKKDSKGDRTGEVQQSTSYALWEDINEAIKPAMTRHGFALSFRTGQTADGRITVTGILSHREGHQEETMMILQHDSTGSKNAVQAIGSSTSYGKRYTASALLNLTSRGEDDDGKSAAEDSIERITEAQRDELLELLSDAGASPEQFCGIAKIESLSDLPANRLDGAKTWIANRKATLEKRSTADPKSSLDRQFGGGDA